MVVVRVTKKIVALERDNDYKKKLYKFVQKKIDELKDNEKKEKNQLDGWI